MKRTLFLLAVVLGIVAAPAANADLVDLAATAQSCETVHSTDDDTANCTFACYTDGKITGYITPHDSDEQSTLSAVCGGQQPHCHADTNGCSLPSSYAQQDQTNGDCAGTAKDAWYAPDGGFDWGCAGDKPKDPSTENVVKTIKRVICEVACGTGGTCDPASGFSIETPTTPDGLLGDSRQSASESTVAACIGWLAGSDASSSVPFVWGSVNDEGVAVGVACGPTGCHGIVPTCTSGFFSGLTCRMDAMSATSHK